MALDITDLGRRDADNAAEMSVLSCFLLSPDELLETRLKPEHFKVHQHQKIFEAMSSLSLGGQTVDVVTVGDKLGDLLEQVGGYDYIYEIAGCEYTYGGRKDYEDIVIDYANRRKFVKTFQRAVAMTVSKGDLNEVIASVYQGLSDDNNTDAPFNLILDTIQRMESDVPEETITCPTGYPNLDEYINGYRQGAMIIIGARPSVGKSTLILNLMIKAMEQGVSCALFSTEMMRNQVSDRFLSHSLDIPLSLIEARDPSVRENVVNGLAKYEADVRVYDRIPGFQYIVNNIRREASSGAKIIFIDYLQQISNGAGNQGNRNQEIGDMSTRLKMLANELKITIVVAAQLNRQSEGRTDKRPTKSDLRDSGNIEQDADIVILLHDEEQYDMYSDLKNFLLLIIDKNRHGKRTSLTEPVKLTKKLECFKLI